VLDTLSEDIEPEMKTRLRRAGQDGNAVTGNLVAALFSHDTTRPLKEDGKPDPHLHIHAYCFNRTWAEHEGRWQAAQLGDLHLDRPYLEACFEARLGARLRGMGYELERDGKGSWEIAGVPESVNHKFSRRRFQEILPEAERRGITDPAAKAQLASLTRQKKGGEAIATDALRDYWNGRLSGDEAQAIYPATPFPVDVFPEDHQRYIREGAAAMNCPPDFFGVPMLVVAGGAIGNSFRLAVTNTHHQSAALYAAVVGRAGSVKSPALEEVARPLEQAERRHHLRFREQMKAWRETPEEEREEKPTLKRVLVDDTTTEALGTALEANPRGLTMVRDELAALVCGLNQYKAGKGHDRQIYLKIWNHATSRIDRKNNPDGIPLRIYRPFLAILGGIQPSILDMLHGNRGFQRADDGYLDRYLFAYPEDQPAAGETWREITEQASGIWASTIDRLLDKEMTLEGDGTKRPWLKRLTKTGKEAWVTFTTAHAAELNSEKFPENLRGAWSKLRGYCARLALILHCLRLAVGERVDPDVDGESVRRAVRLVDYFKDHARRVHGLMATDRDTEAARRILQWIDGHDRKEFKRWEVWKDLESQEWFPRIEDLDEPLARLIRHRYLRLRTPPKNPCGGRPADPVYEVNPLWDRRVNRVNPANPSGGESLHGLLGLLGESDEAEIPEDWMDGRELGQEG
jgi:hypothetical protein